MRSRSIIAEALFAVLVWTGASCSQKPEGDAPAPKEQAPSGALNQKQKAMLKRVIELLQESGHWNENCPLHSVRFDEKRKQWEFLFTDMKPDSGVVAYISDENSEWIDMQFFPGLWEKYERKRPSNQQTKPMR